MAQSDASPSTTQQLTRLKDHFEGNETSTNHWEMLWKDGTFIPWDRGTPSPALVDALSQREDLLGKALRSDGARKRALVPGCGKGYDVLLLASFGYDAWGLEASESALIEARKVKERTEFDYPVHDEGAGRGTANFVVGDFLSDYWLKSVVDGGEVAFDVIYDYTFLCALPPMIRPRWALRMSRLLERQGGNLVCLEFPTYKEPSAGGPPWALYAAIYEQLLTQPGEMPKYNDEGYVIERKLELSDKGLVRIAHWKPERTHPIGKDTDWMSVWRHQRP